MSISWNIILNTIIATKLFGVLNPKYMNINDEHSSGIFISPESKTNESLNVNICLRVLFSKLLNSLNGN